MTIRYNIIAGGFIVIIGVIVAFFVLHKPASLPAQVVTGTQLYQSNDYGFSLEHPSELDVREFYDEEGETIVFQKGKEKFGFQIFITSFEGVITRERILQDLPSTVIEAPQEVIIGDGTRALIFWSESPEIGRTREVWFAKNGYLYEVTTYAALDTWLAGILKTWAFIP